MKNFKIIKLTPDLVPDAIDVLRDTFFPNEKVLTCVRILEDSPQVFNGSPYKCTQGTLELEHLCEDAANDNISVVAVDLDSNEVLGVAFNKIQVLPPPGEPSYFEIFRKNHIQDPSALITMDFMVDVDSRLDLFKKFNATCSLELMFLGVKNSAKGQGIGQALIEETIKIGVEYPKEPKPVFISAIFSSRYSQKAGVRAGMEILLEIPYTDFEYKGRKYSEIIGPEHPFATLSAKKL